MRILIFFSATFLLVACSTSNQPETLEGNFLASLQKNNFELLKNNLPDIEFYKSLGDKMPEKSDEEIMKFLEESNDRIKIAWQNTVFNASQKKIDLNKIKLKEVIIYDPFKYDETSEAMIINYEYENKIWDDLQFIVDRGKGKTYLLAIPNPTRAFSMEDSTLKASNEAKVYLEIQKPEFKKSLEEIAAKLIAATRENNLDTFGQNLIYRGEDPTRKWRSGVNMNDTTEKKQAAYVMERFRDAIEGCTEYKFENINTENESEGTWIILPLDCGGKKVTLAFLRANNKLLLGDLDVERKVR